MAFLATLNMALSFRNIFSTFILYKGPGGPEAALHDKAHWTSILSNVAVVLQTLIGDAILICRCYIVYGRKWTVVGTSMFLWFGGAVCSALTIFFHTSKAKTESTEGSTAARPFFAAFFGITLVLNLVTTGLIIRRIWSVNKLTSGLNSLHMYAGPSPLAGTGPCLPTYRPHLARVMRTMVAAGLAYTVTALITFATYLASCNVLYALTNTLVQVTGISFNLIIIRLDRGLPDSSEPRTE